MRKLLAVVVMSSSVAAFAQKPAEPAKPAAAAPAPAAKAPAAGAPAAGAPATGAPPAMMPPKPGPETEALKPFAKSVTSTGTMAPGAMGNATELATKGKSTCKWILNNLWVACDIEETTGTGKTAMKWAGHLVFGWDGMAKGYRGTMTSTMGDMTEMKGTLDGTKLTWETGEMKGMPPGAPTKGRITLDAADPKAIKFTEEGYMNGKWVITGTATHKPAGK
jgi:hypothetical protein